MTSDLAGVALVVAALLSGITSLVAAVGVIYVSIRQLPQVHKLVNQNFTEQKEEITLLREEIANLKSTALTKAEAREAPYATEVKEPPNV